MLSTGSSCDTFSACDPYVKLFINSKHIRETAIQNDTEIFNANILYVSRRVRKQTMLKLQVWDSDDYLNGDDDLIHETEGNVHSFLQYPIRYGARNDDRQNIIETTTFWRDEIRSETGLENLFKIV